MSQRITGISGQTSPVDGSYVYVTFSQGQFPNHLNAPLNAMDRVPSFIYLGGHVIYEKDNVGNMVARNTSGGESV